MLLRNSNYWIFCYNFFKNKNILYLNLKAVSKKMNSEQKCDKHSKEYTKICLAEDCPLNFLICEDCDLSLHKHSKTEISLIKDIR